MTTVKLGRASARPLFCTMLNSAAGRRRPFNSRFPRSSGLTTVSTGSAMRLLTRICPVLGLSTKPGGEVAYRANCSVAGTVGKADLAQNRIALCDAGAEAELGAVATPRFPGVIDPPGA